MSTNLKWLLAAAFCCLLPALFAFAPPPQDQTTPDPFREESRWNFAKLQYTNRLGEIVDVPAVNLTKIWLVDATQGEFRLELLYENGDYSSIQAGNFHVIRRSANATAVDVPIVRTSLRGMAFPNYAKK